MKLTRKLGIPLLLTSLVACGEKITEPPPIEPPPVENHLPVISSSPSTLCNEHNLYVYEIHANDSDFDQLTYSLTKKPSWLNITGNLVSGWCPEVSLDQPYGVEVAVSDGKGETKQPFMIMDRNVSNSRLLTQNQLNTLTTVDSSALYFSQPVDFVVNDVVASGISTKTPDGFLRQVTSVSPDKKTIGTKQATLEQTVMQASLSHTEELSPVNVQSFSGLQGLSSVQSPMSPEGTEAFNFGLNLNNVILYDQDGNTGTTYDQVVANGNISFNTGFNFDLSIKNFKLEKIIFQNTTNETIDLTVRSNLLGFTNMMTKTIAEYKFNPIILGYLPTLIPIPVIVTPKLNVDVALDPSRVNPISISVKQDANLTTRLGYENGWTASAIFSNNFEFLNPLVTGDVALTASAGPTLKFPLYGVSGPYAGVAGYLRLQSSQNDWKLFGGLNAFIGAEVKVLGKQLTAFAKNVLHEEKLLTQKGGQTRDSIFTDSRDGRTYKTVKIVNQTWMAENLNYNATGSEYFENNPSYGSIYGRLYDWSSSKTACPANWHLPTADEWKILSDNLGGSEISGGKIKTTGTIEAGTGRWHSPNTGATNESGFSAQPGGEKDYERYSQEGSMAIFWALDDPYAAARYFTYSREGINYLSSPDHDRYKFSIRCLKN